MLLNDCLESEYPVSTPSILLVEDDMAIAQTIIYALQREHFLVRHCFLASEALSHWYREVPDLTVLDVGLPDQNGFELCKQLRRISARPILFLSAHSEEIDRVLGFELGADDYLCKPFSPRELVLRVKALLRRSQSVLASQQPQTAPLPSASSNQLTHDAVRACICFGSTTLILTRSEYCLLAMFLAQPERVFNREQLLLALGPASEDSSDRSIDTLIKQLRAKLRLQCVGENGDSGMENCIITHRGLGYSLRLKP